MRVVFILPGPQVYLSGGVKVIFEYANRLANRGYNITVVFWCDTPKGHLSSLPLPLFAKKNLNIIRSYYHPRWFSLDSRINKKCVYSIDDRSIPDSDWVFATTVLTAEPVASLSKSKGRKGYVIQGFENWDVPDEVVRKSYKLGLANVVVSSWLKGIIEKEAPGSSFLISNPVDSGFFNEGIERRKNRVSVLYHENPVKGFEDAYKALQITKEIIPDLNVEAFGIYSRPNYLPDWLNYTRNASTEVLRKIYSSSQAYICASKGDGFGLTGLEALACGTALISTNYRGVREYAIDGNNALLSPVSSPEQLAENLVKVLKDSDLRERLGTSGERAASGRSWDIAVRQFENVLSSWRGDQA